MASAAQSLGDAVGLFVATFNSLAFFLLKGVRGGSGQDLPYRAIRGDYVG
jgi:hypothetical protein